MGVIGGRDMTVESALAKLAYLLAKDLTPAEIRKLMPQSIRGELTPPKPIISDLASSKESRMKSLFSRLLSLSAHSSSTGTDSSLKLAAGEAFSDKDITAVEDALNPLLIASAAAKPDDSLATLLKLLLDEGRNQPQQSGSEIQGLGLLNIFSTHSSLHIACLHGIVKNVQILLQYGASIHLRDVSGHTALYYAITSHHASREEKLIMIQELRSAGAHLSQHEHDLSRTSSHKDNDAQLWTAAGCS